MDIKEKLRTLPKSYEDFVVDIAAWMEKDENIKNAVLAQLDRHPESTPSDILKLVCNYLGMTKPMEIIDDEDTKVRSMSKRIAAF